MDAISQAIIALVLISSQTMRHYEAKVVTRSTQVMQVHVSAPSSDEAKRLIRSAYCTSINPNCIIHGPYEE